MIQSCTIYVKRLLNRNKLFLLRLEQVHNRWVWDVFSVYAFGRCFEAQKNNNNNK